MKNKKRKFKFDAYFQKITKRIKKKILISAVAERRGRKCEERGTEERKSKKLLRGSGGKLD